ncbi:MAG: histidinol dehydrogenase [Acidobacteriota bacterium]
MIILDSSNTAAIDRLLVRSARNNAVVARRARVIVDDVRRRGDRALRTYAERLDGLGRRDALLMNRREILRGSRGVDRAVARAIRVAAENISHVAERELPRTRVVSPGPGIRIELRVSPLARVGCYVPGGRHPLISSLLMAAVAARVAGVRDVVVACPRPVPAILFAARVAGVSQLLRAGGAQAIAALAYGTGTLAGVDKIVGPGNAYVAAAKALVAPDCAIDFYAGPTELVVVSDRGNPAWIAADLVAQAEHDPDARAILLTPNRALAAEVAIQVLTLAPRFGAARESIARNGAIVVTRTIREAAAIASRIAPEHVSCDSPAVAGEIHTAGTIFVGPTSVPALGDYVTGSNHVLPTAGAARARGGLSAADFTRTTTVQRLTRTGARRLRGAGMTLARAEGLLAHALSIEVRG